MQKIQRTNFRFFFKLYLCFFLTFSFQMLASQILNPIPLEDQKNLEDLFNYLLKTQPFAQTIFGEKPISTAVISIREPMVFITPTKICYRKEIANCMWLKWQTWTYYQQSFHIKKYLFIEEPSSYASHTKNIFIINKDSFTDTVNQHQVLFKKNLGSWATADKLLEEIENRGLLNCIIQNNQLLYGILLGFGKHNARLYQKREKLILLSGIYENILIKESKTLIKIEKKIDLISSILQPFEVYPHTLLYFGTVQFVADTCHPETGFLKEKYKNSQAKISAICEKNNLLEITLSQLSR